MYTHTLNHEENKRNVVPFYEHSPHGAEESSKAKPDTQLDPDRCISKTHLTYPE